MAEDGLDLALDLEFGFWGAVCGGCPGAPPRPARGVRELVLRMECRRGEIWGGREGHRRVYLRGCGVFLVGGFCSRGAWFRVGFIENLYLDN